MTKIAKLIVPGGIGVMGTHVELEDATRLKGVQSIKLVGGVDNPIWRMTVEVTPEFIDQLPIDAELTTDIGKLNDLTDDQLAQIGLQRIKD